MIQRSTVLLVFLLLLAVASGCARARARTLPEQPALEPPPPPPRLVQPMDFEAAERAKAAAATEGTDPSETKPPATDRPRERVKPDVSKEAPPSRETAETKPPEPGRSVVLETTAPGAQGEVERKVRALMSQARNDLDRVDYQLLNADGRTQYNTSKRFIEQAEQALADRNLVFAGKLADKAATLARLLLKR